jgi:hypothetical protein
MNLDFAAVPAVIVILITGISLLVSRNWQLSIILLALQYLSVYVLISLSWPLELAVVKLVAGWIAGAILGLALANVQKEGIEEEPVALSGFIFRLLAGILAALIAYSLGLSLVVWAPEIGLEQAIGGVILIAEGLVHLGLTARPFRVILGLLTVLSGFEIIYGAIEQSTLVTGLLALMTLGLALIGAYLLISPTLEEAG